MVADIQFPGLDGAALTIEASHVAGTDAPSGDNAGRSDVNVTWAVPRDAASLLGGEWEITVAPRPIESAREQEKLRVLVDGRDKYSITIHTASQPSGWERIQLIHRNYDQPTGITGTINRQDIGRSPIKIPVLAEPVSSGAFDVILLDNSGAPSTVLDNNQPFSIDASWSIDRSLARLISGQWAVDAYVESIGPGPEQRLGGVVVTVDGGETYETTIQIPARQLPDDPESIYTGVYKVVSVLTHRNYGKASGVGAVAEGPLVRILQR